MFLEQQISILEISISLLLFKTCMNVFFCRTQKNILKNVSLFWTPLAFLIWANIVEIV